MNNLKEQLVKVVDFWMKSIGKGNLHDRDFVKKSDLRNKEIIDLVGPRRSGKSSILKLIMRKLNRDNYLYVNFEDPFFITQNEPGIIEEIINVYIEYFSKQLKYLFFDEIQEVKNWEKMLRKLRDTEKYKIFITGSSSKLLSREISSVITGRHISYNVMPLSFKEYLQFKKITAISEKDKILKRDEINKNFHHYLDIGGFPEPVITNNQELLKNYFHDILEKDIVMRYDVREKDTLEKLAVYLMSNSGKIYSIASLKKIFSVSFLPLSSYIKYLKESLLLFELSQFSFSLKKQEKAYKKIYSIDTGLCNAISFKFSEDKGRILENAVFLELKRKNNKVYYYKTKNNLEVDFLIQEKNKFNKIIQVVWSLENEESRKREFKSLFEAMDELKLDKGFILTDNEKSIIREKNKTIEIIPVYEWLLKNN